MTPDEGTRARLALLVASAPAQGVRGSGPFGGGWVPERPPAPERSSDTVVPDGPVAPERSSDTGVPEDSAVDGLRLRDRALASAVSAYTAAYGHPLEAETLAGPAVTRRWATPARMAGAAAVALVLIGGVVVARAAQQSPGAVIALDPAGFGAAAPGDEALHGAEPAVPEARLVVHVVGQVLDPGVVTLPEGSRVADAVEAAGGAGPEADLSAVNLARVVVDGEQVVVPRPGEALAVADGEGSGGLVGLNSADVATFDTLPGIGPVLAQRIVDWRDAHGAFSSVDELAEVSGIGPALLGDVRDLVTVG